MRMTGNTLFITGGGSGIGRGLAEAFHALGNQVIISGRRKERLQETLDANPGMAAIELDITDPNSIQAAAQTLIADYQDVNVLINNAGVMLLDHADKPVDDALALSTVTTNLLGPMRMTSALIEHLKARPDAVIVNVSSGARLRADGRDGGLFGDQGGAPLLHLVTALPAAGTGYPTGRSRTALGTH